jgi:hypothetical protein
MQIAGTVLFLLKNYMMSAGNTSRLNSGSDVRTYEIKDEYLPALSVGVTNLCKKEHKCVKESYEGRLLA